MNTNIGLRIWQTVRARATSLFAFLSSERRHRAIRETERCDLELTLVVGIVCLMLSLHLFRNMSVNVLLNLFFLPVVVSAFYLGRRRAWLAAMLSIFAAIFVFAVSERGINYFDLSSWSCVLVVSAWCVGTLSDELNGRFKQAIDAHVSETRTDSLTNIANRRSFDDVLAKQVEKWKKAGTPFCLAIADIDHFKRLNDNYGHRAGDKMLHDVARSLETTIRKTDIVARYGGEEFAIVMPNTTGPEAIEIAERVRMDIEATRFFHERAKLRLTISIGVSEVIGDDESQAIIQRSDEALYASKQAGRNRTHLQNCEGCVPFGESDVPVLDSVEDSTERQPVALMQPVSNSILDPVTHLPKREIFLNELSRRACELDRYGYEFAVGIVRIQSYDSLVALGPTALNRSLNIFSEQIRGVVRDPDLVVRYSSDTFAILMPSTTAAQGKEALNRVRLEIAACDSFRHRGKTIALQADTAVSQPQGKAVTNVIGRLMAGIEENLPANAECV